MLQSDFIIFSDKSNILLTKSFKKHWLANINKAYKFTSKSNSTNIKTKKKQWISRKSIKEGEYHIKKGEKSFFFLKEKNKNSTLKQSKQNIIPLVHHRTNNNSQNILII